MTKKVHILFLMAIALLPVMAQTAVETPACEEITVNSDTMTTVIEEMSLDTIVADSVPIRDINPIFDREAERQFWKDQQTVDPNLFRKYRGVDFHFLKNTTNPAAKPYTFMQDQTWVGIPVFLAGLIAKSEKYGFQQDYNKQNEKIRLIKYNFHSEVDNYTQFTGIALTAGLKMAGVEGRSSWPRLAASSLASYAVMAAFVNSIKYSAGELRPDLSTHNSWPSGHTATAFVGATILHKEYGLTRSPWYSIAGYGVATATGVMRVLNNRHWVSDVLSGAGIGILSTELAYGICDLLFKEKGLLMNDLSYRPDLSKNPTVFSISMGIGLGNKNLSLPPFEFMFDSTDGEEPSGFEATDGPMKLLFRSSTVVGAEGAWFFCPYVGVGGRLRVKSTPIKGWKNFTDTENEYTQEFLADPIMQNCIDLVRLNIDSDHITEFSATAGVYFNLPLSTRFALGSKLLMGNSVMGDIDVTASFYGNALIFNPESVDNIDVPMFIKSDNDVIGMCDYASVNASNSMLFGTGLSLTWAYKNSFSWRLFCDYDYTTKTYTAKYSPYAYLEAFSPDLVNYLKGIGFDITQTMTSSTRKHLHQWVLGGALCVSF